MSKKCQDCGGDWGGVSKIGCGPIVVNGEMVEEIKELCRECQKFREDEGCL